MNVEQPGPADDGNRATNIAGGDNNDGNRSVTNLFDDIRAVFEEPPSGPKPGSFLALVDKTYGPKTKPARTGAQVPSPRNATSYALAALGGEADNVLKAPGGTRNDALNRAAFAMGTLVGAGQIGKDDVVSVLTEAARRAGLEAPETARTIESGVGAGIKEPRLMQSPANGLPFDNIREFFKARSAAEKAAQDAPGATETAPTLWDELAADTELARAVKELQTRRRAKEIDAEIEAAKHPKPAPDAGTLAEMLGRPLEPSWRIEGLLPAGGRMLWSAQRKTGKTTALGNLARSLLTGEPFLDRFPVRPITGRVVVLNYEVSGAQFSRWMHDLGVPADRLYLVNLRGRRNLLADEAGRAELAAIIRDQDGEALLVDPFGRAFTGKSQNDAAEVTPWLVRLDEVAEAAGVTELVLTAHAGWDGERTRGSTALEDWPDVIVTMTRAEDTDQRFIKAMGRDVDVDEDGLAYDATTRRLSLSGSGSRKQARTAGRIDGLARRVVEIVLATPGINVAGINAALHETESMQRGDTNKACQKALDVGLIRRESGPRNSWRHYVVAVAPSSPDQPPGSLVSSPDPLYTGVTTHCTAQTSSSPEAAA